MTMKSLSVINFIRYYVDDFYCDLVNTRKDYVKTCRRMSKLIEQLYLDSSSIDDFIIKLYDEILFPHSNKELALHNLLNGLIQEIKRLRKYDVYCA